MDTQKEEVIVQDPSTGVTQATQSTSQTLSKNEAEEIKAIKKNQILWYIVGVINTLLALRIVFLLLSAREAGFTNVLYSLTNFLVIPFKGIFASPSASGSYFDSAAVLAIVIYTIIAWGLSALINVLTQPSNKA